MRLRNGLTGALLLLFVFSLPLMEWRLGPVQIPEVFLLAIIPILVRVQSNGIDHSPHVWYGFGLLIAGSVLSVPLFGVNSQPLRFLAFPAGLLLIAVTHLSLAVACYKNSGFTLSVLKTVMVLGVLLSLANILQSIGFIHGIGRTQNWYSNFLDISAIRKSSVLIDIRGSYSSLVLLAWPLLILNARYSIVTQRPWRSPLFCILCALVVGFGTFLTGSRSTWIAIFVSGTMSILLIIVNFSWKRAVALAFFLAASFLAFWLDDALQLWNSLIDLSEGTYNVRITIQELALSRFRENGYVGVDYSELASLGPGGHYLHNAYLVLVFAGGIPTAIAVFTYVIVAISRGIASYFRNDTKKHSIIAGTLLAGCSSTFVEWLAYGHLFNYASWLGICLLFLVPSRAKTRSRPTEDGEESSEYR